MVDIAVRSIFMEVDVPVAQEPHPTHMHEANVCSSVLRVDCHMSCLTGAVGAPCVLTTSDGVAIHSERSRRRLVCR